MKKEHGWKLWVRPWGVAILILLLTFLFAGCGSGQAETAQEAAAAPAVEKTAAEADEKAESEEAAAESEATAESGSETDTAAPGDAVSPEASSSEIPEEVPDAEETGAGGTLVVYFSRTGEQYDVGVIDKGNTAIVAEMIAERTGADLFEILPEEDYPYTYEELTAVAKQEQSENARPAYQGPGPDLAAYDTVFIGAPVWWGDWPMILYTFFEENAASLSGKTLIPFSTHAGSGLAGFDQKLASACPDSVIEEGLAIAGTDAQNDRAGVQETVNSWLSDRGY